MEARHNPAAAPGQVRLYLQSEAQVQQVAQEVQGRAIDVGGDLITIEVSNDFYTASVTLPKTAREPGVVGPWRSREFTAGAGTPTRSSSRSGRSLG